MRRLLLLLLLTALNRRAVAEEAGPPAPPGREPERAGEVSINYEDEAPRGDDDTPFAAPIEQIFRNPAFVQGLASGADALNRSVESLMDSLFYSLLDNELNLDITKDSWFSAGLRRDLFTAPNGAYVVVDRIQLGPRYGKELWRAHEIPVTLGVNGSVEVLQIYLRTDGMRLAEQQDLPPWRRWVNNWFGLLPLATAVLPPSFNQNELYDPLRQLETPFVFPLSPETFYDMPVGSIRSYAISGGVRVPVEFGGAMPNDLKETLEKAGGLREQMPYAPFKLGEHRINVLRRSEHIAWVGLKDLNKTGHQLSPLVGTKAHILRGALAATIAKWKWIWKGVPVGIFPLDLEFEQALAKLFDQVYEYDLRIPEARKAYTEAVQGDFTSSRARHLDRVEKGKETGVVFHFTRQQDRQESNLRNSPNFAVFRRERHKDRFAGEVEITDAEGKFYVLETQQDVSDKVWDILVGEEETRIRSQVELKVRRVVTKDAANDEDQISYAFEADPSPMTMTMTMAIQDRFVDVVDYRDYLSELRFFTKMPIAGMPEFELRSPEKKAAAWRNAYLDEPGKTIRRLHLTPQQLGGFGASAVMTFDTEQIDRIVNTPENDIWFAFAQAYGVDPEPFADPVTRVGLAHQLRWFEAFFLYPTKLFNVRLPWADAISEATNGVKQLLAIRELKDPQQRLQAFYALVDSDHPLHTTRALLDLADAGKVPRRVVITTQAKGPADQETKARYARLNNKTFKAGPPFPPQGRYARAQQTMAAFYLDQPRDAEKKPQIQRILVTTRDVPASLREIPYSNPSEGTGPTPDRGEGRHVDVTFRAKNIDVAKPLKVFVRVEQAGKVKLGKLLLAEQVVDLVPLDSSEEALRTATFEFFLTGPLSPISRLIFDESITAGDQLAVTMSVSSDGNVWSTERSLEFRFDNGRLTKPD